MFIEMLIASMLAVLGLGVLILIKTTKSAAPMWGVLGRYRNYRKERREAFLSALRKAVLKYPFTITTECSPGGYTGRVLLL